MHSIGKCRGQIYFFTSSLDHNVQVDNLLWDSDEGEGRQFRRGLFCHHFHHSVFVSQIPPLIIGKCPFESWTSLSGAPLTSSKTFKSTKKSVRPWLHLNSFSPSKTCIKNVVLLIVVLILRKDGFWISKSQLSTADGWLHWKTNLLRKWFHHQIGKYPTFWNEIRHGKASLDKLGFGT